MPVTINQLLHPQVIVDVVSKLRVGDGLLPAFMGWDLGSGSVKKVPTRHASFRIFNATRQPAEARYPATAPAVIAANPVGEQQVTMARFHEKMVLDGEKLGNQSLIAGPNAQLDQGGKDYIAEQIKFMAMKFKMSIHVLCAGFIRGQLYLKKTGERLIPVLTAPTNYDTIDFKLPAANKTQLDLLGGGSIIDTSWDNVSAPIVKHILSIRAAFVQLTGMELAYVMVNSIMWNNVINNTSVRSIGGVLQSPWESYSREPMKDYMGREMAGKWVYTLRAVPEVKWIVNDEVLSIDGTDSVNSTGTGTLTKVIPNEVAVFMPTPDSSWAQMWHGGELISEDVGRPMTMKMGFNAWKSFTIEPTAINLVALLNALPVPYIEKAWAYGTTVF